MKPLEFLVFSALAAGVHLGALALWKSPGGEAQGGQEGTQNVTIASASASHFELIRTWERPPITNEVAPVLVPSAPLLPQTEPKIEISRPILAALPAPLVNASAADDAPLPTAETRATITPHVPQLPTTQGGLSPAPNIAAQNDIRPNSSTRLAATSPASPTRPPNIDTSSPAPSGPLAQSKRPKAAPERIEPKQRAKNPKSKKAKPHSTAQTNTKAAWTGNNANAGQAKNQSAQVSTSKSGEQKHLKSAWAARIKAKIQRNLPATPLTGKAHPVIRVTVARSGKLLGVTLIRSSGNAQLDQHALRAGRTSRIFPRAPKGLTAASYSFNIGLKYN